MWIPNQINLDFGQVISVFGSVIAVIFQITFRVEIHANDVFYFLKIIFDISTSKRSKKYKPHSILAKKIQNLMKRNYKRNAKQTLCTLHARFFFGVYLLVWSFKKKLFKNILK